MSHGVYVWHVDLDRPAREVVALRLLLSRDERERASRMRAPGLERRFIVCRATLRLILARHLGRSPEALQFEYSAAGKPELADVAAHRTYFNVTHSADAARIAITQGESVGVDLEHIRSDFATTAIAERFFSVAERAALKAVPEDQKAIAFFRCWTRKEAFVKAIGTGIGYPLDEFDVSLAPQSPNALLAIRGEASAARQWTLRDLPAEPGFVAALAIARQDAQIVAGEPVGRFFRDLE